MTASPAFDESGVQYYFQARSPGGNDSGWVDEPNYTDVNLTQDTMYCYRVMARDKSLNQNENLFWSAQVCTTTLLPPDRLAPLPNPMLWDNVLDANNLDGTPREVYLSATMDFGATMRAILATDQAPFGVPLSEVQYKFVCTTDSDFSSGGPVDVLYGDGIEWRSASTLPAGTDPRTYTVRMGGSGQAEAFIVIARDALGNETFPSTPPLPALGIP